MDIHPSEGHPSERWTSIRAMDIHPSDGHPSEPWTMDIHPSDGHPSERWTSIRAMDIHPSDGHPLLGWMSIALMTLNCSFMLIFMLSSMPRHLFIYLHTGAWANAMLLTNLLTWKSIFVLRWEINMFSRVVYYLVYEVHQPNFCHIIERGEEGRGRRGGGEGGYKVHQPNFSSHNWEGRGGEREEGRGEGGYKVHQPNFSSHNWEGRGGEREEGRGEGGYKVHQPNFSSHNNWRIQLKIKWKFLRSGSRTVC